jgi:hypothetical protein
MSSHHIVREGQEPALLVYSSYFNTEVLYELLEWSPVLIVFADALQRVIDLDVKIDLVFCDVYDTERVKELILHQGEVIIMNGKMPEIYNFMNNKNYAALNIIGNNEPSFNDWQLAITNTLKTVYFSYLQDGKKHYNAKSYLMKPNTNSKWMGANMLFGIKALSNIVFSISGNYKDTEKKDIYETFDDGFITINGPDDLIVFEEIF